MIVNVIMINESIFSILLLCYVLNDTSVPAMSLIIALAAYAVHIIMTN
jgi:hypothetical protein